MFLTCKRGFLLLMAAKWSLSIEQAAGGAPPQELWRGAKGTAPSGTDVTWRRLGAVRESISPRQLSALAAQVVARAPAAAVPDLLARLACSCSPALSKQPDALGSLPDARKRTVCGVVFKKGEIVWTCRSCAKDNTCVQCDACFRRSAHVGHEVYFHRSTGRGGCCDCGDPEAWATAGNCSEHCAHAAAGAGEGSGDTDPSLSLPEDVRRGFRATVEGIARALVDYVTLTVRGFEPLEARDWERPDPADPDGEDDSAGAPQAQAQAQTQARRYVARLHNDDVHTFEEVINALVRAGIPRPTAHVLTTAVDHDGHAPVHAGPKSPDFYRIWGILNRDAGLLFSVLPETVVQREDGAVAAVNWLISLGSGHAGLARVVAQVRPSPISDTRARALL